MDPPMPDFEEAPESNRRRPPQEYRPGTRRRRKSGGKPGGRSSSGSTSSDRTAPERSRERSGPRPSRGGGKDETFWDLFFGFFRALFGKRKKKRPRPASRREAPGHRDQGGHRSGGSRRRSGSRRGRSRSRSGGRRSEEEPGEPQRSLHPAVEPEKDPGETSSERLADRYSRPSARATNPGGPTDQPKGKNRDERSRDSSGGSGRASRPKGETPGRKTAEADPRAPREGAKKRKRRKRQPDSPAAKREGSPGEPERATPKPGEGRKPEATKTPQPIIEAMPEQKHSAPADVSPRYARGSVRDLRNARRKRGANEFGERRSGPGPDEQG